MAVENQNELETGYSSSVWLAGAMGGLLAGIVMGFMLQMVMTPVITKAIPALYGLSGLTAGWAVHLAHSVGLGVLFAAVVSRPSVSEYADTVVKSAGLGSVYGLIVWVVAAGIIMPAWLSAVGFPGVPPLPNFNPMSLIGHLAYGVVLGVVYGVLRKR